MEYILTFERTMDAIQGESCLLEGLLDVKVMSLPSSIQAGCGICLRVSPEQLAQACLILDSAHIVPGGLYQRTLVQGASQYTQKEMPQ